MLTVCTSILLRTLTECMRCFLKPPVLSLILQHIVQETLKDVTRRHEVIFPECGHLGAHIHILSLYCRLSIYSAYTVHILSIYCLYTAPILSTVHILSLYCPYTVPILSIYRPYTFYILSLYCPYTVHHIQSILSIYCLHRRSSSF